jgi:tRNA nucleotidyltransferase (CCA-adding enzyme)
MDNTIRQIAIWLDHHHMKCYYVGGCVRDELRGQNPSDIDVCIVGGGAFKYVQGVLESLKTEGFIENLTTVHGSFPIWILESHGKKYEFAMARKERKIGQSRTDFECEVQDVTIEEDLMRRDFTINAIAKEVLFGEYVDPYGGRYDLSNRIVRHVSDAFSEDPLRVYRAARFAARFDFSIDSETLKLCKSLRNRADEVSMERVGGELKKVMNAITSRPSKFFMALDRMGWLDHAFKELHDLKGVEQDYHYHPEGDAYVHTLHCMNATVDPFTRVVMLCHDLGKATTTRNRDGRWTSYGHEEAGVPLTDAMLKRIKYDNWKVINQIKCLVKWHMIRINPSKTLVVRCLRELMHVGLTYQHLVDVCQADYDGRPPLPIIKVDIMQSFAQELIDNDCMTPIVTGELLISIGIEPGEEMGNIIEVALKLQDRGTLRKDNWQKVLKNANLIK